MKLFTIESDEIYAIDENDLTPATLANIANWQVVVYRAVQLTQELILIEKYDPHTHRFTAIDTYDFGDAKEEDEDIQKTRKALLG